MSTLRRIQILIVLILAVGVHALGAGPAQGNDLPPGTREFEFSGRVRAFRLRSPGMPRNVLAMMVLTDGRRVTITNRAEVDDFHKLRIGAWVEVEGYVLRNGVVVITEVDFDD